MSPLFSRPTRPFPPASEHEGQPTTDTDRTYEGRRLTRPQEELVDQGLTFDIATLATRRRFLGVIGAGAATTVLAACTSGTTATTTTAGTSTAQTTTTPDATASTTASSTDEEMPTETAGPYPGDGSNGPDVLDITGVERSDIRSSIDGNGVADGVTVTLTMNIIDMANDDAPFTGAAVYLWQADALGQYSMYSDAVTEATYLRGVQVAGAEGTVTFTTIFPGCYDGRWPHMHFEVFPDVASITDATNNVLTSQIAMPEDECSAVYEDSRYTESPANFANVTLATDNVFSDGWDMQLPTISGSVADGYTMSIDVPIDTTTEQEAASAPAAGGGPGGDGTPRGTQP